MCECGADGTGGVAAVETVLQLFTRSVPRGPAVPLPGVNLRTHTFIAAVTPVKMWEQPRHPAVDKRLKKMWGTLTRL